MGPCPVHLLEAWGIGGPVDVKVPGSGTMNDTWIVTHGRGRVVMRRHRLVERARVEFEHLVLRQVQQRGIPVPLVMATNSGEGIAEEAGRLHTVYSWVPGEQLRRGEVNDRQARQMGRMLAAVHVALSDLNGGSVDEELPAGTEPALRLIEVLMRLAERTGLGWVQENLEARRRWLEANPELPVEPIRPTQVIHGDYQDTNLLFHDARISAVIDWDRARRARPVREVVRAMDHGLGMRASACRAFLQGYRDLRHLSDVELAETVEWFQYQQATSLWLFNQLLVEGNDRVSQLITPEPFVPFATRWERAGLA